MKQRGFVAVLGSMALLCALHNGFSIQGERQIKLDETRHGSLLQTDPSWARAPRGPHQCWSFAGSRGQQVTLACSSYEFNSHMVLVDPRGRELAWSDDSDCFFNPRISATLPSTGRYMVVVCGLDPDQFGTYWLSLRAGQMEEDWSEAHVASQYNEGLRWAARHRNDRAICWLDVSMGKYLRERGRFAEAEECYARADEAARASDFRYGSYAVALERGRSLARRMLYAEAIGRFREARVHARGLAAADVSEAMVQLQLYDIFSYLGRSELARVHLRNAGRLAGVEAPATHRVLLGVADADSIGGQDSQRSMDCARRAYELSSGLDPRTRLEAICALARANLKSRRYAESLRLLEDGLGLARRAALQDEIASVLNLQGPAYFGLGEAQKMMLSAREAADLCDPHDPDPAPRRRALQTLADGEMAAGNHRAAMDLCERALDDVERAWEQATVPELRERYLSQAKAICTEIVMCLDRLDSKSHDPGHARKAFEYAERCRSRELLVDVSRGNGPCAPADTRLDRWSDPSLLRGISALGRRLAVAQSGIELSRVELDRIEGWRSGLVARRIEIESGSEPAAPSIRPLSADQVQREFLSRHPRTAILVYQTGIRESYLIVLKSDTVQLFRLSDWNKMDGYVAEWQAALARQYAAGVPPPGLVREYAQAAHTLYKELILPAEGLIRDCDLVVVADSLLAGLPIEALVVTEDSRAAGFAELRYLVQEHAVTYAPSVSVLVEIDKNRSRQHCDAGNRLVLFGDPVFSDEDQRARKSLLAGGVPSMPASTASYPSFRTGLRRLPATRDEVLGIARMARESGMNPEVRLDFHANETNLKKDISTPSRIVHLATHAIADPVEGDLSEIVLSLNDPGSGDDGVLTAAEVQRLRVDSDLVVLGGCSTGTGQKTRAEGTIGLSRAFLAAGAGSVCASLWNVEDVATNELMDHMYGGMLSNGRDVSSALQQAKVEMAGKGGAPCTWAAFVLVGDPSRISRFHQ
ncbi:MAG: CHAT domain-containing protein [Acidobacteriota bacterium]